MLNSLKTQSNLISSLLEQGSGHLHFIGISGVGMAGLAYLMHSRGFEVSGCDLQPSGLSEWLTDNGIKVMTGHSADHITSDIDCVIRSTAIDIDSPELLRAAELDIPIFARGTLLPRLLEKYRSIAVSGTHGKTTTSSFIAMLLQYAGADPTWCIGGESEELGAVAASGAGKVMVVEADESDGTVAGYSPDIAVITNVEFDHMEHFADIATFEECFKAFIKQTHDTVVFCNDDPQARALCSELARALSYGLTDDSMVRAENIVETADGSDFDLVVGDDRYLNVHLSVPGRHNILNALGAVAAISALGGGDGGVAPAAPGIVAGLSELSLPKRRFERVVTQSGLQIISDYAHHPTEIRALVQMSEHIEAKRRIAVFQPHRYTRTKALGADFPAAFAGVDQVILLPVYAASEQPIQGGTHWDLYEQFLSSADSSGFNITIAESCNQVWEYLRANCTSDDLIMIIGAGNVVDIVRSAESYSGNKWQMGNDGWRVDKLEEELKSTELRRHAPLAGKTTIKVGGKADLWAEVGSEEDLIKLQTWAGEKHCGMMILGHGSNLVIGDLGIRGVVVRLTGNFKGIREEDGALVVGAAVPAALLLTWMEKIGGCGLEFLEAIPASVGGMLKMNAGAYGDEILNHILWIRCLNSDGTMCTLQKDDLVYGYRSCSTLNDLIVLEAGFKLEYGDPKESKNRRVAYADKRRWMRGLRSCGSVFKNPEGDFAGRLIEEAGLKGKSIGGAAVSEQHANFIITDYNATASDVQVLIEHVRAAVLKLYGIDLVREVKYL